MMTTAYDDINFDSTEQRKPVELHPRGTCKAVCVDVIALGQVENSFKKNEDGSPYMQERLRIVWETSRKRSDGKPFTISKSYAKSLYDGANGGNPAALYVHLSSWMGSGWNGRFTSRDLVGREAELFIEHEKGRQDKTKTFAKILAVHPLEDGQTFEASGNYKRFVPKSQGATTTRDDDEETPF